MTKCQICGHDNPSGVEYCEDCGASLVAAVAPQQAASATPLASPTPAASPGTTAPLGAEPATPPEAQPALPVGGPAASDTAPPAASADASIAPAIPPLAVPSGPLDSATGRDARLISHRYGAASGEEYPLLGDRLVVGRFDPETGPVDIDLSQAPEAPQLSRHHAELYREADGRWHVKDLGSTNGVFVKSAGGASFGPRLTVPQALTSGDEVAFGNARFIFRLD